MRAFLLLTPLILGIRPTAQPIEREVYAMGTILKVTLFAEHREEGIRHIESLVRVVEETEQQLSNWRQGSELSRLNRQEVNQPFAASSSLFSLFLKLKKWTSVTGGAFDPTVGRLIQIWGIHDSFRTPGDADIARALEETGVQYLNLEMGSRHMIKTRSILLDAGAFGKGEALDRVLTLAREQKLGPLLLDFGGQLAANRSPPQSEGWNVSVADPANRLESSSVSVALKAGSLSTSGGSERDGAAGGRRIGHIVDPATGQPVSAFGSVTVWHSDALVADILSTALYVMGPEKGFEWACKNKVAACFLILSGDQYEIRKTSAFERLD